MLLFTYNMFHRMDLHYYLTLENGREKGITGNNGNIAVSKAVYGCDVMVVWTELLLPNYCSS